MKSERTFTSILRDLAENSSVHGIPKTVSSKQKPVKVLWCLLFLGTFAVFGLQIYNLFSAYYSFPVQTAVSLKFSALRFPAVTFCNMNPVKLSQINKYPYLHEVINPKVKKKADAQNRRKREAPDQSSIPFTSTPVMSTAYESTPVQATTFDNSASNIPETTASSTIVTSPVDTTLSNPEDAVSSASVDPIAPSSAGTAESESSSSASYYYEYDYWGNWWWYDYDYNSSYSDSYYSSSYYSDHLGGFYDGYSDSYETSYGINGYVHDQLFSPKDQWDERIVTFQAKFKNETLTSREGMGHKVKEMVISASFASSLQNVSLFEEVTTTRYGNCYTMTSPKYIAMRSGPAYGIKLTLNLEMDEYIKNFASGYGIRMVFHEPGTYPLPADEGLTLSPGYETSIGLRMVKVTRLGPPHGHCSDGTDFYRRYKIRYSVTACMMFCRIIKTIQNCKCIPSDSPDFSFTQENVSICFTKKDKECQLQVDLSFDEGSAVEQCNCISPCKELVYQRTMSGRRWPNDDYLENVLMEDICSRNITSLTTACAAKTNKTFDPNKYRYNFLRVLIYFEDLNYESIDQEPLYESVRFLSDIGGAMGLFMGASLLSFVELLQLILEMVLYVFRAQHSTNAVNTLANTEKRKDSVYPVTKPTKTTIFNKIIQNPCQDPHAVQ